MRHLTVIILVVAGLHQARAQQPWHIDFGIGAGASLSTYMLENIRSGVSRQAASSYNGQLRGWVEFSPNNYVALETGVNVMGLGGLLQQSEFGRQEVLQHTYWLQVPVSLIGKLPLRDSSHFFLRVGMYGGLGLLGINYVPDNYSGNAQKSFNFGNHGSQRKTDYGALMSLGYRLRNGYGLAVGYLYGKANLAPDHGAYEQRNRAYTLSLDYRF